MNQRILLFIAIFLAAIFSINPARAAADGPDGWAVDGVAVGDVLNIRVRPDASSPKIGEAGSNATGLKNLGCNEESFEGWTMMNIPAKERVMNLRWCKVEYQGVTGWVRGKFLKGE